MPPSTDDNRFLKKLGLKLREIREEKGWTLEQAEERGVKSWRHLQRMESGHNSTILSLRHVAKVYRIKLKDIFSDIE